MKCWLGTSVATDSACAPSDTNVGWGRLSSPPDVLLPGRRRHVQHLVDYFARAAVPVVIVAFNAFYWGAALMGEDGGIEL